MNKVLINKQALNNAHKKYKKYHWIQNKKNTMKLFIYAIVDINWSFIHSLFTLFETELKHDFIRFSSENNCVFIHFPGKKNIDSFAGHA